MIYSPDGLMRYNDSNAIVDDMPLLSQWIKKFDKSKLVEFFGTLKGTRTPDPLLRRQMLYPAELSAHIITKKWSG